MMLMKMLCPMETTIYPGWNDGNKEVIRPMAELSKSKDFDWTEEKDEEWKSKHKGNKRHNLKFESKDFDWTEEKDEEEGKSKHKGNKRCNLKFETITADLLDSDVGILAFASSIRNVPLKCLCLYCLFACKVLE
jgi:hypothetical protein